MRGSEVLLRVYKTTGGKAWLPKWGFRMSPTQKVNRKQNEAEIRRVIDVLKQAAAAEPGKATPQAAKSL